MLTAKYEQLGLQNGDKVLDLGCGFGRHAFEAARRGASVVALDAGTDEVNGVAAVFIAMVEAGELAEGSVHDNVVQGDVLRVVRAPSRRPLGDGRTRARASTGRDDGHYRATLWSGTHQLGPLR